MKLLSKIKAIWFVGIVAFISAWTLNNANLATLSSTQIRNGETVITNDDASYLNPPSNYLSTGEWKDNVLGKQAYFNRPPGYGLVYLFCLSISSTPAKALFLLKLLQTILFALSIVWIYHIAHYLFKQKRLAFFIAVLYGVFPFANGFLFYTLTEGLTPAFLVLFVYLLFRAEEQGILAYKRLIYLLAAIVLAHLVLVRPLLGLFGLLFPVFLLKDYMKTGATRTFAKIMLYGLVSLSLLIAWQTRNFVKAEEYVDLHGIYYKDGNSIYRPTFKEYWNFVGGWAQTGATAHSYMVPMWQEAIEGNPSNQYIDSAIASIPTKVVNYFGEERLRNVFKGYQLATLHQKSYFDRDEPMPKTTPKIEQQVIAQFELLTAEFKQKFWLDYYLISPLKVFKEMAFHSNLSLHLFQHEHRGKIVVEAIRYISFGIHSLCFVLLILSLLFIGQSDWRLSLLSLTCFLYVFYLCYFQRGIEERYTLPILPLLMLIGLGTLRNLLAKLR